MTQTYSEVAKNYATGVVSGIIPACHQIVQAGQRFLTDLEAQTWVFDEAKASHACAFIELLPHTKGELARKRQRLKLEPWQVFIVVNIFGFTDEAGLRRYREAFLLIPRKAGKSTLAAGIAHYMAFADGEMGAEVWIGANSMDQANAVFEPARKMAEVELYKDAAGLIVWSKSVEQPATGNFIRPMIGKPKDGTNPHLAVLDEQHEAHDATAYDAMRTGMGARTQPLLLTITTAGVNLAGPCFLQQRYAESVLSGDVSNDRLFAAIWTIDDADDWTNFDNWVKANPNIGVSISEEYLRAQHAEALQRPEKAAIAQTKHLNRWVSSKSAWLNMADWSKAADTKLTIADLMGCTATIGLDLATKTDIAALVVRVVTPEGRIALFPYLFVPEGALTRSKNAESYRQWAERGHLIVTDGEAIDFTEIEETVRDICKKVTVEAVGFDPWQAQQMAQNLMRDGVNVIECPANTKTFSPAMIELEANLLNGTLVHPGNGCLSWMAGNVVAKPDARGNIYPNKPHGQPHLKIDGVVAALMAEAVALREPEAVAPADSTLVWLG